MMHQKPGGMRLDIILGNRKRPGPAGETDGSSEYTPPASGTAPEAKSAGETGGSMGMAHMRLKSVASRLEALGRENALPELQELSDELTSATAALYSDQLKGKFASPARNDDFLDSLEEEA